MHGKKAESTRRDLSGCRVVGINSPSKRNTPSARSCVGYNGTMRTVALKHEIARRRLATRVRTCARRTTTLLLLILWFTAGPPLVARSQTLALEVDTVSGQVRLTNRTISSVEINGYELTSAAGSLDLAGWNSLSDQNLDAVDGPDAGTAVGNGVGETWDEAAGSSNFALQEGFLFGSTILPAGGAQSLGSAFDASINVEDLSFKYRRTDGTLVDGGVDYLVGMPPGDFDGDGGVDGADLIIWNANFGSTSADAASGDADDDNDADGRDFLVWQRNLTGSLASQAIAAVPEPGALALAAAACLALAGRRVAKLV
jgi:hypothetical protein